MINWGAAGSININGIGDVYIKSHIHKQISKLQNCYMPEIGINIISQSEMTESHTTIIKNNKVYIQTDKEVIAEGYKFQNLFYMNIEKIIYPDKVLTLNSRTISSQNIYNQNTNNISRNTEKFTNNLENYNTINHITSSHTNSLQENNTIDYLKLHARVGHISISAMNKILESSHGYSKLNKIQADKINNCETCLEGKFTNKINKEINHKEFTYLEKVSSDICGPMDPPTYDNYKYFITFLDIKTRYLEVKLLRTKDETITAFIQYANIYENNAYNKRIRILATDNGTEYTSKRFKTLLDNKGIVHQPSPVYTKEPNGIIERVNRTILNKIRCMLEQAKLPKILWGEAYLSAVYLYNHYGH
ncbi:hypothetical protein K3495_g12705 [Podosphaera aphanis]|nr:hypothetical protein K3495_g12705 [Podosphaera aphanis]